MGEDEVELGDLLWTGTYFSEPTRFGMATGEDIVERLRFRKEECAEWTG